MSVGDLAPCCSSISGLFIIVNVYDNIVLMQLAVDVDIYLLSLAGFYFDEPKTLNRKP